MRQGAWRTLLEYEFAETLAMMNQRQFAGLPGDCSNARSALSGAPQATGALSGAWNACAFALALQRKREGNARTPVADATDQWRKREGDAW